MAHRFLCFDVSKQLLCCIIFLDPRLLFAQPVFLSFYHIFYSMNICRQCYQVFNRMLPNICCPSEPMIFKYHKSAEDGILSLFFALVMGSGELFISGHHQRHTQHFRADVDENNTYRQYMDHRSLYFLLQEYIFLSKHHLYLQSIIVLFVNLFLLAVPYGRFPISVNFDQNGKLCIPSTSTTTILWFRVYFYFIVVLSFGFITLRLHRKFNRRFILN